MAAVPVVIKVKRSMTPVWFPARDLMDFPLNIIPIRH